MARFDAFVALLTQWNARINLVSPATLADVWTRHIADSAQLWPLAPPDARSWLDIGAGAGFPGLVVGALAADAGRDPRLVLVESDARKCAFLGAAARALAIAPEIRRGRAEAQPREPFDVVSARAVAPVGALLRLAQPLLGPRTTVLLPKGATVDSELTAAAADWHSRVARIASLTDPRGAILVLREVQRVPRSQP